TPLSPSLADALCRLTSGAGVAFREPDHPELIQQFLRRPILMTLADDFTLPKQLAARALIVDLPELTPETRDLEGNVAAALEQMLPQLLAALCAAISRALANPPQPIATVTRHADALAWACAAFPDREA